MCRSARERRSGLGLLSGSNARLAQEVEVLQASSFVSCVVGGKREPGQLRLASKPRRSVEKLGPGVAPSLPRVMTKAPPEVHMWVHHFVPWLISSLEYR